MKPIKLLHLVASSHGGAATHLRDLALGLPSEMYQLTVGMPLDGGNVSAEDFIQAKANFLPLDIDRGLAWSGIIRLKQIMQREAFDLVHCHGARSALYARLALAINPQQWPSRPKVVFSVHGFATPFYRFPKKAIYLGIERFLQKFTDLTICVAQAEADLFLSFGLTHPEKVQVLSYGIDVTRFRHAQMETVAQIKTDLGIKPGPVILTVCRLNVPRDFQSLLTAFKEILTEHSQAQLLIVGDGPQRPDVEALIDTLSLQQYVILTGFRDDIPHLMTLADIYVLTSYGWEGYPISTLEAQSAATPVIVTDAGGSKESVLHQKTGLVVPKNDAAALAQALSRLLSGPAYRQQLGRAGQQRAKQEFTREQMLTKMMAIYHSLLR